MNYILGFMAGFAFLSSVFYWVDRFKSIKSGKRMEKLEEFLGVLYNTSEDGWVDYYFKITDYNMKPQGVLGELKTDLATRQEAEAKAKKETK